ncbi:hypothetical protein, partial [Enterobacter cloacae]|uniref:hypothetical protein n=1 Tax=Enterobacter cloacae TaxID=550 RepID=UPI001955700E
MKSVNRLKLGVLTNNNALTSEGDGNQKDYGLMFMSSAIAGPILPGHLAPGPRAIIPTMHNG